ncbi:BLUF domain-containing protein [Acinetobacter sp. MD2]|uniref:BLUF domain-containing protein n=1 Tax=Acinetobacter sp. MD2 TaxID=2600066 RepID=UPI002D1F357F|nr:BLUF domain-containing protein [Acinetobacter sp. MD2]MEB3767636.1 BLUF domain-containing protein [Acinetobacter sp. MD2]
MQNIRLLYASKKTNQDIDVKADLMQILNTAVDFNYRNQITGVLYYGYGYFAQWIEGSKEIIDYLFYQKIILDSRHQDCEILLYQECEERFFKDWSMKFAPINQNLKQFFADHHASQFNPYLISKQSIDPFIHLLVNQPNTLLHNTTLSNP